jgi:hypothetical protein
VPWTTDPNGTQATNLIQASSVKTSWCWVPWARLVYFDSQESMLGLDSKHQPDCKGFDVHFSPGETQAKLAAAAVEMQHTMHVTPPTHHELPARETPHD